MPEQNPPELPASTDLVLDEATPSNLPAVSYPDGFLVASDPVRVHAGLTYRGKPVYWDSSVVGLCPKRTGEEWLQFTANIKRDGIRDKVRLAELPDSWIIADGNDRVLILRTLQEQGHIIDLEFAPIALTDPTDPVKVLADARAFAIQANLADRQQFTEAQKVEVVKRLDLADRAAGFMRAGAWIADLVGCSQGYVSQIRKRMKDEEGIEPAAEILTRTGQLMKNSGLTPKAAKVETIEEPDDEIDNGQTDGTEFEEGENDVEAFDGTEFEEPAKVSEKAPEPVKPKVAAKVATVEPPKPGKAGKVKPADKPLGPIDGFRFKGPIKNSSIVTWQIKIKRSPERVDDWALYNGEPWYSVAENQWYKAVPGAKVKIAGPYRTGRNWSLTPPIQNEGSHPWRDSNGLWHHADGTYIAPGTEVNDFTKRERESVKLYGQARKNMRGSWIKADGTFASPEESEAFEKEAQERSARLLAIWTGQADELPEGNTRQWFARLLESMRTDADGLDALLEGLTHSEVNAKMAELAAALVEPVAPRAPAQVEVNPEPKPTEQPAKRLTANKAHNIADQIKLIDPGLIVSVERKHEFSDDIIVRIVARNSETGNIAVGSVESDGEDLPQLCGKLRGELRDDDKATRRERVATRSHDW